MMTTTRSTAVLCQRYRIAGMSCGHCERAVAAQVSKLAGVTCATADATRGTLVLEATYEVDPEMVAHAVDEAGYEVVGR